MRRTKRKEEDALYFMKKEETYRRLYLLKGRNQGKNIHLPVMRRKSPLLKTVDQKQDYFSIVPQWIREFPSLSKDHGASFHKLKERKER
jgi:hypothetical protein